MKTTISLNRVLVIDDVPIIASGLQNIFSALNPYIIVEPCEDIFRVLSSPAYKNNSFDLVVLGIMPGALSLQLQEVVADLKAQLGTPKILLFVPDYDHTIIEKMQEWGIDAYVHKQEIPEELQTAYTCMTAGKQYISTTLHTLYNQYHLNLDELNTQPRP